jgi:tripartite-type tricarboxylate transporter receptor subunit TctC
MQATWRYLRSDAVAQLKVLASAMALLVMALVSSNVRALANYPDRPIRLIVAFPAGGGPDLLGRIVAEVLARRLGQPVVVENLPGGRGSVAARTVARAPADGYTLQFVEMSFVVAPHMTADYGVKPLEEFQAVGFAATSPFSLIVSSALPVSNVAEFVKLAEQNPDQTLIGHTGVGTTPHLAAVAFAKGAGINPRLVFYRGIGDAMTNAMSGTISGFLSAGSSAINANANDKLKVLAVTGETRMPQLPNVPTFSESGITMHGFETGAWFGVVAPAGTPSGIVEKINAALQMLDDDADAKAKVTSVGARFKVGSPKEFEDFLRTQDALWATMLADLGLKPD